MIYKKIKDTIPSLSGLLLAGLMVGGCKEKKDSPSTPAEHPSTENNKQKEPENKKAEGSEKAESQEFLEACSQFMKKILQGLGLDFLKKAPGPIILEEADLGVAGDIKVKNQGQKVADNLTKAAQSFSQYSCYTSIKDLLKDFAMLKYHVGSTAIRTDGLVHKHAVGQAFNAIAIPVNGLRKVYLSLEDQIDAKKSPKGFKKLAENDLPNEAEKLLDARTTHLKETHRFDDTIKTKLLDGDQLARFLTGKDNNGVDKDHSVSGILKQGHEDVWIYNRTPDKACSKTVDDIPSDSEQAKKYLAERGAGISGTWKVKGASMPIIDPIDNGQLAPSGDHKFTVAPLLDAQKTPKTKAQIESIQAASFFTSLDSKKGQSFNDSAARQQALTNGQLLFTLFKGDTDYDFLKIAPGEAGNNKSVVLTSNDGNFQKLKSIISKKKTADEEFAKWLGAHISNNVAGIFHIPNINHLKSLIWVGEEVTDASGTDEVNKGGDNDVTSDKFIGENSIIHKLYTYIVTYFGLTSDPVLSKLLASVKQLGNLHDTDPMKDSDATIEERVLIYLAKKLTEDSFLQKLHDTKVKSLEDNIDKWLKEITDYAIVRETKQGAYECTKVTSSLFYFLDQFCKELENKKADASVTYALLKGEINKIRKQNKLQPEDTNFDIEAVRKALVKDCDRLKGVLELDVTDLINRQADITLGDLPDYLSFVSADIAELNKIRKDYKEKKASKANAPAA